MVLNDEEKADFLSRVQNLLEIDVITKDVRDTINWTLIAACMKSLREDPTGADAT